MIRLDPVQVAAARRGSRAALEAVVRAAERPVYNLALRMLAHPADAQDATQEILIKIVTNLGALREVEAAGGWAMRIACRHLVGARKHSRVEAMRLSFADSPPISNKVFAISQTARPTMPRPSSPSRRSRSAAPSPC